MIGFSNLTVEEIKDRFSSKCVCIDFTTNPLQKYESINNKTSKVFICDLITAKYLVHKLGRKLKGFFVIKDSFFNLKTNRIKCVDVASSGLTVIKYNPVNLDCYCVKHTKFPKSFDSDYIDKGYNVQVSSLLSKKKTEHDSLDALLDSFLKVYKGKDAKELLCKALTNNISYLDLDTKKIKFSSKVKKFLLQHKLFRRAIIAYQDMMYNLTDMETAIRDIQAERQELEKLLNWWNPNPKNPKEVFFRFNKKPLPKAKQTPKRLEKWKKQKHDIPKVIFEKRKEVFNKNKRKHVEETKLNFYEIPNGKLSIKEFMNVLSKKAGINVKEYYVLGSTHDDNIILRKDNIISVIKKNSNSIIYVKVV